MLLYMTKEIHKFEKQSKALQLLQTDHYKATNYKLLVSRPGETMKPMRAGGYYYYLEYYYCTS